MRMKSIGAALIALSMGVGGVSMAQDRDRDHHDGPDDRAGERHDPPPHPEARKRVEEARHDERGAGPDHAFRRGGRLPPELRDRRYVVEDWRAHHLSAPPRGYQWVQTGADFVLVAVATGIIAQVLLSQ